MREIGVFLPGSRQSSEMRREPVVFDTLHGAIENFHNDGTMSSDSPKVPVYAE